MVAYHQTVQNRSGGFVVNSLERRAADLIAARLASGIVHPGNPAVDQPAKLITLPGFSGTGIPPEMATYFADEAGLPSNDTPKLVAEAIVHLLTTDAGLELVDRAEAARMRAQLSAPDTEAMQGPQIAVHCRCNPTSPLLAVAASRAMVTTNGPALRERINTLCTCT